MDENAPSKTKHEEENYCTLMQIKISTLRELSGDFLVKTHTHRHTTRLRNSNFGTGINKRDKMRINKRDKMRIEFIKLKKKMETKNYLINGEQITICPRLNI